MLASLGLFPRRSDQSLLTYGERRVCLVAPMLAADVTPDDIGGDSDEPGADRRLASESPGAALGRKERGLEQIGDIVFASIRDPAQEAADALPMSIEQRAERCSLTCGASCEQGFVGHLGGDSLDPP